MVEARRCVDVSWTPRPWLAILVGLEPVLLLASALLPAETWGRLFWRGTWHQESYGIGYDLHTVYCIAVIAAGAVPLLRQAERTELFDRICGVGAAVVVCVGVAAQLVEIRIMHLTAFVALVLVSLLVVRRDRGRIPAAADLAERDGVTGVLTRAGLDRVLEAMVARVRQHGGRLCVLVIDVDGFKGVNDVHGHLVGDQVLRQVAVRIGASVDGVVGRFGGDEFVVVLPGTDLAQARDLAQRVVVEAGAPFAVAGVRLRPTISVGVAEHDGGSVRDLLAAADAAMYDAKRRGGDAARSAHG
jgi:diguanylate cyclase (GGDEF)-like protein